MVPVLPPGTYIWATRWYKELQVGDVVVFRHDNKEKIKRISDIKDKEIFLLGDHVETSTDSRHFGWIDKEKVIAKVFWPHAPRTRAEGVESGSQPSPDK
jgi:signal peptidase I